MTKALATSNYSGWSDEEAENDDRDAQKSSSVFMKYKVGKNPVRFLPKADGAKSPFIIFYQHFIDVPNSKIGAIFACPKKTANRPCPVCAKAEELAASKSKVDKKKAKGMWPGKRIVGNVLDRQDPESGVKVAGFSIKVWDQLMAIKRSEDAGDFTDPSAKGFDIVITRSGTGKQDTSYVCTARRKTTPLASTQEEIDEILEGRHDLALYAAVLTPKEIIAKLTGDTDDDDDDDIDDEDDGMQLLSASAEGDAFGDDDESDVPY